MNFIIKCSEDNVILRILFQEIELFENLIVVCFLKWISFKVNRNIYT